MVDGFRIVAGELDAGDWMLDASAVSIEVCAAELYIFFPHSREK